MSAEWVAVRNCMWMHEAQFFKSLLDSANIETLIPNEYTLGVQPGYTNMLGGIEVLVRPGDVERATELLDSVASPPRDPEGEPPSEH